MEELIMAIFYLSESSIHNYLVNESSDESAIRKKEISTILKISKDAIKKTKEKYKNDLKYTTFILYPNTDGYFITKDNYEDFTDYCDTNKNNELSEKEFAEFLKKASDAFHFLKNIIKTNSAKYIRGKFDFDEGKNDCILSYKL
jgi:hypothetical protein